MTLNHSSEKKQSHFKLYLFSVIFSIIGFIVSWFNMLLILESSKYIEVLAYLSIILTTMIPGVIIALKKRYWGYSYLSGFSIAGIPFMILIDLFIGAYTCITTIFIFAILWLIFWKAWRSLDSIKIEE